MPRVIPPVVVFMTLLCACPSLPAADKPKVEFSDEAVQKAIAKGAEFLWSQQKEDGGWGTYGSATDGYPAGPTALAALALLESGVSPHEPRMVKALAFLTTVKTEKTYDLGLRANVWLSAGRTDKKYMELLQKDVDQLVNATSTGSYAYVATAKASAGRGDNSNSQYGLLGAWAGARGNLEISNDYWYKVMKHWLNSQNSDGGWPYYIDSMTDSRATMTAAGLASLFVCLDSLLSDAFIKCNVSTEFAPVEKGLEWFERNYPADVGRNGWGGGYLMYGVERVGLACGYKYFGAIDWYKSGATGALGLQKPDGSWDGRYSTTVETSFVMLFLARGQHPVLFNKLKAPSIDWNNRPRALASVTSWISNNFEATVNWQIVNLQVPVAEWHDAPILYLTGTRKPQFTDEELAKLREFVWQGGTIFSCAEASSQAFSTGMKEVYQKLFPGYELVACGKGHDLYSVYFKLPAQQCQFQEVTNGIRPLAIHTSTDLPLAWQLRNTSSQKFAYEAAANVFLYVTGTINLRHRGTTVWPEEVPPTGRIIKLARLKYDGKYDPEPLAYKRFAMMMANDTKADVQVGPPVDIAALAESGPQLAVLTGTGPIALKDEEKAALKAFVEGGGTLVLDAAGGASAFSESAKTLIGQLFGEGSLKPLAETSAVYIPAGNPALKIEKVKYRKRTATRLGTTKPNLQAVTLGGRAAVIFSAEDITAGLLGVTSHTCDGYDPASAYAIARNIVLYAANTAKPAAGN